MLKKSEEMCRASLQEDEEVEEEDVDRETGIIRVQLAYAIQMQVIHAGQLYGKFTATYWTTKACWLLDCVLLSGPAI